MKRLVGFLAITFILALTSVGVAGASTTVAWKATFSEQVGGPINSPFSCPAGTSSCGSGEVNGLGQAQDVDVFGACGAGCDVRTLTFADGSTIVMDETASNFQTPGSVRPNDHSYGNPFSLDLSDTIVAGTGRFAGASGNANGQVKGAGGTAIINLSGTITF